MFKENATIKGIITAVLIRDGKVIEKREIKNTITDVALAELSGLIGDTGSKTAFTYLAVGTGTVAASALNTTLGTEITDTGLERASATVSQVTTTVTNDTLQLLKEWTATGAKAITECGAFNASSNGTLFGRQVFSAVNTAADDKFELTYKFVFAGA